MQDPYLNYIRTRRWRELEAQAEYHLGIIADVSNNPRWSEFERETMVQRQLVLLGNARNEMQQRREAFHTLQLALRRLARSGQRKMLPRAIINKIGLAIYDGARINPEMVFGEVIDLTGDDDE